MHGKDKHKRVSTLEDHASIKKKVLEDLKKMKRDSLSTSSSTIYSEASWNKGAGKVVHCDSPCKAKDLFMKITESLDAKGKDEIRDGLVSLSLIYS